MRPKMLQATKVETKKRARRRKAGRRTRMARPKQQRRSPPPRRRLKRSTGRKKRMKRRRVTKRSAGSERARQQSRLRRMMRHLVPKMATQVQRKRPWRPAVASARAVGMQTAKASVRAKEERPARQCQLVLLMVRLPQTPRRKRRRLQPLTLMNLHSSRLQHLPEFHTTRIREFSTTLLRSTSGFRVKSSRLMSRRVRSRSAPKPGFGSKVKI
mmetsp:Transcript_48162/g.114502  ORF Transcript_48162/g.114502 Transcript_48162/m.114502 type:complete len:213 (+) Transcript_48162:441-1079(+)